MQILMNVNILNIINTADTGRLFYSWRLLSGWQTILNVGNDIKATLSFIVLREVTAELYHILSGFVTQC